MIHMKKFLTLCMLFALTSAVFAGDVMKVAILEVVDKEGKLTYGQKLMLRSNLARAVANTEGYEAYDRSDMDAIFSEHDFQRTGNVSASQIKRLGEMTGASYILVAEGALTEDKVFVTAKILNVETTKVEVTDNILLSQSSAAMQRGCRTLATKMFGSLAGSSTSTNKFFSSFTKTAAATTVEDSIAAAQKAEEMAIKEQQRKAEEQVRAERAEAERQAKEERRLAEERVRQEREAAKAKALEEKQLEKERAEAEYAERSKYFINKIGRNEYEYLGKVMDKNAYASFLEGKCPAAFAQYNKGKKLIGAGWGVFASGLAVAVGGTALMIVGKTKNNPYYYAKSYDDYKDGDYYNGEGSERGDVDYGGGSYMAPGDTYTIVGIAALSVGGAMTLASIPILGVGYFKRDNAYKVYNDKYASPSGQPISLNMTVGRGSLGFALQF